MLPVSVKKTFLPRNREKTAREDRLSEHQIGGRRGVSAAGLQRKGLSKRRVFSQTPVSQRIISEQFSKHGAMSVQRDFEAQLINRIN